MQLDLPDPMLLSLTQPVQTLWLIKLGRVKKLARAGRQGCLRLHIFVDILWPHYLGRE